MTGTSNSVRKDRRRLTETSCLWGRVKRTAQKTRRKGRMRQPRHKATMRCNKLLHIRNVAHMNDGCCHVHFVERQVLAFLFPQSGDTTTLLKIPSPSLVAFPKLLGISRIQWHSSGEQLACRNSLLKGAGSWESRRGCSLCAWAGMELSLGMR